MIKKHLISAFALLVATLVLTLGVFADSDGAYSKKGLAVTDTRTAFDYNLSLASLDVSAEELSAPFGRVKYFLDACAACGVKSYLRIYGLTAESASVLESLGSLSPSAVVLVAEALDSAQTAELINKIKTSCGAEIYVSASAKTLEELDAAIPGIWGTAINVTAGSNGETGFAGRKTAVYLSSASEDPDAVLSAYATLTENEAVSAVFFDSQGFTEGKAGLTDVSGKKNRLALAWKYLSTSLAEAYLPAILSGNAINPALIGSGGLGLVEAETVFEPEGKINAAALTAFGSGSRSGFVPTGGATEAAIKNYGNYYALRVEGEGTVSVAAKIDAWQESKYLSLTLRPDGDATVTARVLFENAEGSRKSVSASAALTGGEYGIVYMDLSGCKKEWKAISLTVSADSAFDFYEANLCSRAGSLLPLIIVTVSFLALSAISPIMFPIMRRRARRRAAEKARFEKLVETESNTFYGERIADHSPFDAPEELKKEIKREARRDSSNEKTEVVKKKKRKSFTDDPEEDEDEF